MIKVLVVDDSAYMRHVLKTNLNADPEITVVDTARDGLDGLAKVEALKPDVVTMDLEMPRMDGFEALKTIMSRMPLPIIILSSLSQEGAEATLRALRLGAVDFVPKPLGGGLNFDMVRDELLGKIKQVAGLHISKLRTPPPPAVARIHREMVCPTRETNGIVVIGTSTGGPRALYEVVPLLPSSLPTGVLIVQHMPPGFTRSLAQRLDDVSALKVKEAEQGDTVQAGMAFLAPGNFHMTVSHGGSIDLNQGPPQHGVRPAVDVTMETAAATYGHSTIGVVMTGMGCDGTRGSKLIRGAGGKIIAEDEGTCVVYGMPRSVVEAGLADRVVPLGKIAREIVVLAEGRRPSRVLSNS
ncbi:MAG: chemotaxis response regulator protein-glutamate methylesterase [Chloroflexi bacterium]|nr:chemotaxis response regulator protein-glutamate methylesterase [Chloroflexota bacterium]